MAARNDIIYKISATVSSSGNYQVLDHTIKEIAEKSYVNTKELPQLFRAGFDNAVDTLLVEGIISLEAENRIQSFIDYFNLEQNLLDQNGSIQKIVKAAILRDVMEGKIPAPRITIQGNLPILLQKSEVIIWVFQNVDYLERQTKTYYQGSSQGVSIRITKGVYYRTGSFRGNPVKVEQTNLVGRGTLAVTNKHLFFSSAEKSIKIPYKKIIMLDPYSDGVGLQRDTASAKPQFFRNIDGWFIYNLISNLNAN